LLKKYCVDVCPIDGIVNQLDGTIYGYHD
jgi:hypothetical protein